MTGSELAELAAVAGIALTFRQLEQFDQYEALLLSWNAHTNLTAIREPHAIRIRHFLDSLMCGAVTGDLSSQHLIDVGTGAGFPGLPLKIRYPALRLTLLDSVGKKTRFLEHVVAELGLEDVTVLNDRAETAGQDPAHREQYDWATARSVAELRVLVELLLPFCKPGGQALALKGDQAPAEIEAAQTAIQLLSGGAPQSTAVTLPETDQTHYLVTIPKVTPTPERYPRRPGLPAKRPLG